MALTLGELCAAWPDLHIHGDQRLEITAVTADSRQAGPGTLFVAVRGTAGDGHDHVAGALAAGAPAVVIEKEREDLLRASGTGAGRAVVTATGTRAVPARLARRLHGEPDRRLLTAGVTGTNGKTTTVFLLQAMLNVLHGPCGLLGTIRYDDSQETVPAPLTTPGGPELFRWLDRMSAAGCTSAAMEISSHALDQERVAGLELDAAVMTNLGRDHLDYHADVSAYLAAKARIRGLLRPTGNGRPAGALVLNAADPRLAAVDTRGLRVVRFCAVPGPAGTGADLRIVAADLDLKGSTLRLDWRGQPLTLHSRLVGGFNVENSTAALATGLALGFGPDACAAALDGVDQVPGRLERIALPSGGIAVVDYAHTHDALAAVLAACRRLTTRRLLLVFGCGGDRDRGKRVLMGEVAARDADLVWITSDNPRHEDPATICAEILRGFEAAPERHAHEVQVVVSRREAIAAALAAAGDRDIVVIAGKGHEDYQLVGDRRLDFDDRQEIRRWIGEQGHGS